MTVKQQLIAEIERIDNPVTLVHIFEIMQCMMQPAPKIKTNPILTFAGCLDDDAAHDMRNCIANEFNRIEGEW
jgi:hypothetical protein